MKLLEDPRVLAYFDRAYARAVLGLLILLWSQPATGQNAAGLLAYH